MSNASRSTPPRSATALPSDPPALSPAWSQWVGFKPHRVLVFEELRRRRVLYLRWRPAGRGNWRFRSLGRTLFDERGRPLAGRELEARKAWALAAAEAQYERNKAGLSDAPPLAATAEAAGGKGSAEARPLTLGDTKSLITDPAHGWLVNPTSLYRADVLRELAWAVTAWGADRTWASLRHRDFVALWRHRLTTLRRQGATGFAGAAQTVVRVLRIAQWLRDNEHLDADAVTIRKGWREELRKDFEHLYPEEGVPEPARPRYTLGEMRAILHVAGDVDPRLALALALGAEQRSGQVLRTMRSKLQLPTVDWALAATDRDAFVAQDFGSLQIPTHGRKRGALVDLTVGQRLAVERAMGEGGYLHALEAGYRAGQWEDYPLFPGGRLTGWKRRAGDVLHAGAHRHDAAPVDDATARDWLHTAEARAVVEHRMGRAFYGFRRIAVDEAADAGISPGALQQFGAWSRISTPMDIYKDREAVRDRREARQVRAQLRGESLDAMIETLRADLDVDCRAARAETEARRQDVGTVAPAHSWGDGSPKEPTMPQELAGAMASGDTSHPWANTRLAEESAGANPANVSLGGELSAAKAEPPKSGRTDSLARRQDVGSESAPPGSVGGVAAALGASFRITTAGRDALAHEPVVDDEDQGGAR